MSINQPISEQPIVKSVSYGRSMAVLDGPEGNVWFHLYIIDSFPEGEGDDPSEWDWTKSYRNCKVSMPLAEAIADGIVPEADVPSLMENAHNAQLPEDYWMPFV